MNKQERKEGKTKMRMGANITFIHSQQPTQNRDDEVSTDDDDAGPKIIVNGKLRDC